ncbi:transcription factor grauzone [Drosophila tropicalis]|uniref:transcription factor grauzone n=1 Tax=Drosophila tropicalis TaxID=46794 RepID=UPI0035ABE311
MAEKVCRLCLEVGIMEDVKVELVKFIEEHFKLKMENSQVDPLQQFICHSCWKQVENFQSFCLMVEEKQKLYQKQLQLKEERLEINPESESESLFEPQIDVEPLANINEVNIIDNETNPKKKKNKKKSSPVGALRFNLRFRPTKVKDKPIAKRKPAPDPDGNPHSNHEIDLLISTYGRLECVLCVESPPPSLTSFSDLKRHYRSQHQCDGYVECCHKRYKKRSLYVDHLRMHKDPDYFRCKTCGKQLVSRISYDVHMLRFHSKEESLKFACSQCTKRFSKRFLLEIHSRVHRSDKTDQCVHCHRYFGSSVALRSHIRRFHDPNFVPFICESCGSEFKTKQNLEVHKRTVHLEGPQLPEVQCEVCQKWLRDENSLRKHMYMHVDAASSKIYKCEQCGQEKDSRVKLAAHIRYHHPKEYHKCSVCDKQFKNVRGRDEHMATHTGRDLYECAFCDRTFKNSGNMHKHRRQMHVSELEALQQQKTMRPSKRNAMTKQEN